MPTRQKTVVIGAGPVGALAALYAAQRDHDVEIYELRNGKWYFLRSASGDSELSLSHFLCILKNSLSIMLLITELLPKAATSTDFYKPNVLSPGPNFSLDVNFS